MLLSSITQNIFAQADEQKLFDVPSYSISRMFWVELGSGNKMEVHLNHLDDLEKIKNMDSLIYGFLKDINHFKDSLKNELWVTRVDYNIDDEVNRKIRFQQRKPFYNTYVINDDEVAALKTIQDTVNFVGTTILPSKKRFGVNSTDTRYFKVVFLLNKIADIRGYMNGLLNQKIESIRRSAKLKWDDVNNDYYISKSDSSIKSNNNRGYVNANKFVIVRGSVDIQNYKANFVPSVSVGMGIAFSKNNLRREIFINAENHFSFLKNSSGKSLTNISRWISLTYSRSKIVPDKRNVYKPNFSIGYMIGQNHHLYEKNTFRIGTGQFSLFEGSTKIEPVLYVNDFFKSVTPGLRLVQHF